MRLYVYKRGQIKILRRNAQIICFSLQRGKEEMKVVFLLMLLGNIFFFFWEYNSAPTELVSNTLDEPKQILLLSEATVNTERSSISAVVEGANAEADRMTVAENKKLWASPSPKPIVSDIPNLERESEKLENKISTPDSPVVNNIGVAENKGEIIANTQKTESLIPDYSGTNPEGALAETTVPNEPKKNQGTKKLVFCYQVGPFESKTELAEWSNINKVNEGSLQPFSKYNQNDARYLVYFPAAIDYEISKQNVQFFIDMGITDYWLFKTGNLKGAISLGLFEKAVDALALKEKFFNKGINVDIRESYSNESVLFARVLSIDENFKDVAVMSSEQTVIECE
jgi:hypothetical protein